jgi:hypothetical protein
MAEKEFFNHNDVLVTQSRVVVDDSIYPVNSLSAVRFSQSESFLPNSAVITALIASICIFFLGLIIVVISNQLFLLFLTVVFSVAMSYYATTLRTKVISYHVVLHTSGTNLQVYTSDDKKEIQDIVKAINEAIIARG